MKRKQFNILVVVALVSMLVAMVGIQPGLADRPDWQLVPVNSVTQRTVVTDGGVVGELRGDVEPALYIIQLADAPLASYRGGVAGLEATNPSARGERRLDANSPASVAYLNYLEGEQAQAIASVEAALGRSVEVPFQYRAAYNGFAARLTPEEAAIVAGLPGIVQVQREFVRYPTTDVGPTWIGAPGIWDGTATGGLPGTMGEDIIVGVIDTGINMDHPSFADIGGDSYDHTNPWGAGNYVGLCATEPLTYTCNDKLIGVWNYTDGPEDGDGHGSHTASTAAGNFVTPTLVFPTTSITRALSGVAPHANIIAYDTCQPGGCPGAALVAAIDQAVLDGVDVINYSIGGGASDPWADADSQAFLNARDAGVFVATSAGNAGPGAATMGSPGNAPWLLTVGAATHNRKFLNALINMSSGSLMSEPTIIEPASPGVFNARSAPSQVGRSSPRHIASPDADVITEGFEGGAVPPLGWTAVVTNASYTWELGTGPHSGTYNAVVFYDPALVPQDEWLVSSPFTLTEAYLSLWSLGSVYWCRDDYDNCDLNVWIVVGPDVGDGDDIYVGTADADWPANWTWAESFFDLTSLLPGGNVRLGFQYEGLDGAQISLDDITLMDALPPPADIIGQSITSGYGPASIVYAGDFGDAQCLTPFPAGTWTNGEIVVCDRGTIARVDKGANVLAGGAGGFVLANTAAEGESLVADGHYLPAVHITYADAQVLEAWLASGTVHTATIAGTWTDLDPANGDIMAGFSSRGPNPALTNVPGVIKPDVVAPGVSILAASMNGIEYESMGGTSMSSPHAAGSAALLTALHPGWSPAEIHSALMTTAWTATVLKEDEATPADPFDMGAGRIDLSQAGMAGLVLHETTTNFEDADPDLGGDPKTLNLASFANEQCLQDCSWMRVVSSTLPYTVTWTASIDAPAAMTLTVTPNSFELAPYATQMITVEADVSAMPNDVWAFAEITFQPSLTRIIAPYATGGPDAFGYTFADQDEPDCPYDFVDITLTATRVYTDEDDGVAVVTPTETFDFYGVTYDDFAMASNGYISTDPTDSGGDLSNDCPLPATPSTGGGARMYPLHDDLVSGGGYYEYFATCPRTSDMDPGESCSIFQWDDTRHYGSAITFTFESILYHDSGELVFQMGPGNPELGSGSTTGIQNEDASIGLTYACNTSNSITDTTSVCFFPPEFLPPPAAHFPVAVVPSAGVLPTLVEIETRRNAGSQLVEDLEAIEITDLTIDVYGLTPALLTTENLSQDPTNGDPYDNLNDGTTFYITTTVPADAVRLVAEILESEAPDIDLFVGMDLDADGPEESEEICSSTTPSWNEYCDVTDPAAGTWWILVQNWAESGDPPDAVTLATAVVVADAGNMYVTGPASVPEGTPFDLRVFWDEPTMMAGDRWYGAFAIGTDVAHHANVGTIPVNVIRHEDDVVKTASATSVETGQVVTYTITVQTNVTPEDLYYWITDTIPAGMTYVPGSAWASEGTVNVVGDVVTWEGLLTVPAYTYDVETSVTDPGCAAPLANSGAYVDLEGYGIATNPGISGDTVWYAVDFSGGEFDFFGEYQGEPINFTDDGFAFFDPSTPGATPWTHQPIPTAGDPDNLMAIFWRDMEIVYDAGLNRGVSLANLTSGGVPVAGVIEYDDVEDYGSGGATTYDFEVVAYYDPGAGYEYIFAYDNLVGDVLTGTIGLENVAGDLGVQYAYDDIAVTDGMAVCFDLVQLGGDITITYAVTVDEGTAGTMLTNMVAHNTDNPGSEEAYTSVDVDVILFEMYLPLIFRSG